MGTYPYVKKGTPKGHDIMKAMARQRRGDPPAKKSDFDLVGKPVSVAVWDVFQRCWDFNAAVRPNATELVGLLENSRSPTGSESVRNVGVGLNQLGLGITSNPVAIH
jgi:hypothetical protein